MLQHCVTSLHPGAKADTSRLDISARIYLQSATPLDQDIKVLLDTIFLRDDVSMIDLREVLVACYVERENLKDSRIVIAHAKPLFREASLILTRRFGLKGKMVGAIKDSKFRGSSCCGSKSFETVKEEDSGDWEKIVLRFIRDRLDETSGN